MDVIAAGDISPDKLVYWRALTLTGRADGQGPNLHLADLRQSCSEQQCVLHPPQL